MKFASLLAFLISLSAVAAETAEVEIGTAEPRAPEMYDTLDIAPLPSARRTVLPITYASGDMAGIEGVCVVNFHRYQGKVWVQVAFKKKDEGSDHLISNPNNFHPIVMGQALDRYPLQPGWSTDFGGDGWWRVSYDGGVLRVTRTNANPYTGTLASKTESFDIFTDSNGMDTHQVIVNEYEGKSLDPARTKGKLICGSSPVS